MDDVRAFGIVGPGPIGGPPGTDLDLERTVDGPKRGSLPP